jgi:hypothetical protein
MDSKITDVREVLRYSRRKLNLKWLAIGVPVTLVCLYLVFDRHGGFSAYDWLMSSLGIVVGGFMTVYALYRMIVPGKPMLVLSPAGIRLHIEWVKDIDIPWREVRGVDTIDITGMIRGIKVEFPGVTVVLVSREFYDKHIYIDSLFLRGPGWDTNFIPKGSMVQVALQHEALPATAAELRAAVEARWLAFRGATPAAAPSQQASVAASK